MQVNTQSVQIKRLLLAKGAALGVPVSGAFELTPRCNLSCRMCYVRLSAEEMKESGRERTAKEWLALGQEACSAGMIFLLLTGGEPTLRPDFPEIYEGLTQMGLSISMNTNGTMFTPAVRELFHRMPPAHVNVTIYGASREAYGRLCGDPSAFERTVDTLRWLREEGVLVNLNTTMTPWNIGERELIEELAEREGLVLRMTAYNFPPARRRSHEEYARLSAEETGRLIAQDTLRQRGMDYVRGLAAGQYEKPQAGCEELECGQALTCYAGRSQFWITWDGRMLPCGMLQEPWSAPFTEGFCAAWEKVKEKTEQIRLCADCVNCAERDSCTNCAAVTSSETGRFDGKPEYMCRVNHAYREAIRSIAAEAMEK